MSGSFLGVLALTGILVSFLTTLLQLRLQPLVSPGRTAVIFATEPVFAALFSAIFVGERLGLRGWIGGGLVLAGVLFSELGGKAFRPAEPARSGVPALAPSDEPLLRIQAS
ncbi:MAG: DMT family transporter [Candidatus Eisenbacteria bacterium]